MSTVVAACLIPAGEGFSLVAAEVVAGAGGPDLFRFDLGPVGADLWLYRDERGAWRFASPVKGLPVVPHVHRPTIAELDVAELNPASSEV
ncbi:MAG: hypothetical protein WD341_08715 [Tistlia sp.]|uniref:hypothetical protein n=1 Tax=Tistlia sp. TaxID=3057121 RepID=UPI0034A45846